MLQWRREQFSIFREGLIRLLLASCQGFYWLFCYRACPQPHVAQNVNLGAEAVFYKRIQNSSAILNAVNWSSSTAWLEQLLLEHKRKLDSTLNIQLPRLRRTNLLRRQLDVWKVISRVKRQGKKLLVFLPCFLSFIFYFVHLRQSKSNDMEKVKKISH